VSARRYGCDILAGLQELHSRGIVMMDLKPANVLLAGDLAADGSVAREDRAVLTDFGLARRLNGDNTRIMVRHDW
jgi:serine/threonine protein kinase